MLSPELEESLSKARLALGRAVSGNIVELCKQYLGLLSLRRAELYKLPDRLGLRSRLTLAAETDGDVRRAIRSAIEYTTQERNRTERLLLSFTAVSGYEAVQTLNSEKYLGRDDWELRAGGVACVGSPGQRLSIREATETAGRLRREAYVTKLRTGRMKETPDDSL
jgi:hypothetical protein